LSSEGGNTAVPEVGGAPSGRHGGNAPNRRIKRSAPEVAYKPGSVWASVYCVLVRGSRLLRCGILAENRTRPGLQQPPPIGVVRGVEIGRGRAQILMTKPRLDEVERHPAGDLCGRVGVPEEMRVEVCPDLPAPRSDEAVQARGMERLARWCREQH